MLPQNSLGKRVDFRKNSLGKRVDFHKNSLGKRVGFHKNSLGKRAQQKLKALIIRMFRRKIEKTLLEWKQSPTKMPLIIKG